MDEEKSSESEGVAAAHALFLKKKLAYFSGKTEEAWDAYTEAYYKWIDAVCDNISAEHSQRVLAREGGAVEKSQK